MTQKTLVDRQLVLHFGWQEVPILKEVSFEFPELMDSATNETRTQPLTSLEGRDFNWFPGPKALCILVLRSVAAALDGWTCFWETIPKPSSSGQKKQGKSEETPAHESSHPAQTLYNMKKILGGGDKKKAKKKYGWAWRMFGKRNANEAMLPHLLHASEDRVSVRWDILSPLHHVVIRCNGIELTEPYELERLASEIESLEFAKARKSRSNVPRRLFPLIGRRDDYRKIRKLLFSRPLVTLAGPCGVGKTELCYETARQMEHLWGQVRVVELGDLKESTSDFVSEVARQLSSNLDKGGPSTIESIKRHIGKRKYLLILDNCEHLLKHCSDLVDKLLWDNKLANLQVLATSREPLECRGEEIHHVNGLSYPDRNTRVKSLDELMQFESAKLFLARAGRDFRAERNADRHATAIAEICWALEGIPYTIEIVAGHADKKSPEEIVRGLKHLLSERFAGARYSHQETVHATQEWSYGLLQEKEKKLLRRLSVFEGGWDREAARSVCTDSEIAESEIDLTLDSLIRRCLVEVDAEKEWFHYLIATWQFAADKLTGEERQHFEAQHSDYFLEFAKEREPMLFDHRQSEAIPRLEKEHNNIQAALDRISNGKGDPKTGLEIAVAVAGFWRVRAFFREGRQYIEDLLKIVESESKTATILLAKARQAAGILAWAQTDFPASEEHLQEANKTWQTFTGQDAEDGQADALHYLGMIATDDNRSDEAMRFYEAALEHSNCGRSESPRGQLRRANILISLGILLEHSLQLDDAKKCLEEALALSKHVGDQRSVSITLNNLAYVARKQEDWKEAGRRYSQALQIRLDMEDRLGIAWSLEGVARIAAERNQMETGVQLFAAAESIRAQIDAPVPPYKVDEYEAVKEQLRKLLGQEAFEREFALGSDFDDIEAVEVAVRFCESL